MRKRIQNNESLAYAKEQLGHRSALTGFAWKWGGWNAVCFLAGLFACAALAISWSTLRDPRV